VHDLASGGVFDNHCSCQTKTEIIDVCEVVLTRDTLASDLLCPRSPAKFPERQENEPFFPTPSSCLLSSPSALLIHHPALDCTAGPV